MYCRHCGVRLPQGTRVCPECGTRQRQRASAVRCAYCHQRVPVDLVVCPRCGRAVRPAGPAWGLWLAGLVIVGLAGLYGAGRLPVAHLRQQIGGARGLVDSLVQIPDLPQAVLAPELTATVSSMLQTTATGPEKSPSPTPGVTATAPVTVTFSPTLLPTATLTSTPASTNSPSPQPEPFYTVRSGDTLMGIGAATGFDWQEIARLNNLNANSALQVGQKLRLPVPPTSTPTAAPTATPGPATATPTAEPTQAATATPPPPTATATATATAAPATGQTQYKVRAGDTLYGIADRFGIPWRTIANANGLTANSVLQVGQKLIIPAH